MLAGVVTVKDAQLAEQLNQFHNMIGATLSPLIVIFTKRSKDITSSHRAFPRKCSKLAQRCRQSDSIDEVLYSGRTGMLSLRLNQAYSVAKF